MTLVQKYALLPEEIDRESLKMVQAELPAGLEFEPCRALRSVPHCPG